METLLILALAFLCTAVPLLIATRFGVVRLVSPLHLVGYFAGLGVLLKTVSYTLRPDLAFYAEHVSGSDAVLLGAVFLTGFVMMLCAGYLLACNGVASGAPQIAARITLRQIRHPWLLFGLGLGAAGLTTLLILHLRGATGLDLADLNRSKQIEVNEAGVGATLAGVKTAFILPKCAFVLLLAHGIVARRVLALVLAGAMAAVLLGVAIVSGDRFELVELMIFTCAVFVLCGGRWRPGHIAILAGVSLFGLLLAGYMTRLRFGADLAPELWQQLIGSTYFLDINAAVMAVDRVPPDQHLWGQSYTWWSFGWVPRAIWPQKPAIDLGVVFKRDILGLDTGGAFNVTGPGEAFLNFGWVGIGVGAVLGWVYRKAEVALLSVQAGLRSGAFVFYPLILCPFVQATLQSSFSAFVVGAAAQVVLIAIMLRLFVPRFVLRPVAQPAQEGKISYVA